MAGGRSAPVIRLMNHFALHFVVLGLVGPRGRRCGPRFPKRQSRQITAGLEGQSRALPGARRRFRGTSCHGVAALRQVSAGVRSPCLQERLTVTRALREEWGYDSWMHELLSLSFLCRSRCRRDFSQPADTVPGVAASVQETGARADGGPADGSALIPWGQRARSRDL